MKWDMPPHVAPDERQIREFRTKLGSFEIQSAPKMMSRLAQCFTQARETGIELERRFYATSFDYLRGRDSKDEPYCFSVGVGRISFETAREVSRELKLEDCTPSCYQIRFRGFKGVLSVDKNLDALQPARVFLRGRKGPSQPPSFVSPVGPSTNKSTPAQGGHVNIHTPTRGTRGMEALASSTPFSTEPDPSVRPPGTDQGTTQEGIRRARQKTSTEPSSIGICNAVLTNDK
ncbi:hypothetical protein niasHT_035687 [Heterodera trifolii]|uniref:RNA-dependent RNA polymerase n=1 Tax=Heterodera trifolii TaxID=157864 RepID=A0ABD2I2H0_9BILA